MKRLTRLLSAAMVGAITVSFLTGCGKTKDDVGTTTSTGTSGTKSSQPSVPDYMNATGFPIVKQPITLKAMVMKTGSHANYDYAALPIWTEYEKMTGIKIEFEQVMNTQITEKRNLAFASGDLPDIFYRSSIPDADISKYGEQGMLIKLEGMLPQYAPNFKKIVDRLEDVRKGIYTTNGNIFALPSCTDAYTIETSRRYFINKKWMDKVGMKMPTTTDDLYNLLKAFKDKDANGNGKQDEIPLTSHSYWGVLDEFKGSFGIGNRGVTHGLVDMDEKTGKLRFTAAAPEYKEFLQYANKLYKEGLIDEEIFTMDTTKLIAKGDQDLVGSFGAINDTLIGSKYISDFTPITAPLKGPNGDMLWPNKRPHLGTSGTFAITNKCKYPEAALRWIDYFYSEEGVRHMYMGTEGKTYRKTADGKYEYMVDEILKNEPAGTVFSQIQPKYFAWPGGYMPTIVLPQYFTVGENFGINVTAADYMKPYYPKEVWSAFQYTSEEREKMTPIQTDLNGYINQMIPQFITGKVSFSEWDSYVDKIKKMGVDEYLKIYTAAYERYKKN